MQTTDVLILGAGASGLMCARSAGLRGRSVLVLDHAGRVGQKILISGGGRCNFTNRSVEAAQYVSRNPHFCKSALRRFTPYDILDLLEQHHIPYEERSAGQFFCATPAKALVAALLQECEQAGARVLTGCAIQTIERHNRNFILTTSRGAFRSQSLVIATGGLSYKQIGASGFGYDVARQFGLNVLPCAPGLVPLTVGMPAVQQIRPLAGIAVDAAVRCRGQVFRDALLFTHSGFSGPVILQISNYWGPGDELDINLLPAHDLEALFAQWRQERPKATVKNLLATILPKRLVQQFLPAGYAKLAINQCRAADLTAIAAIFQQWRFTPSGTAGYANAEVTTGGVDTAELSSKTFEARHVPGLYFIGEVLDVTGWLGGYNLHWAWASGHCAGLYA